MGKQVPKCPPFLDVFHLLSVTNPHLPLIWVDYKNVLLPPERDPLHLSKLFTYLLMILLILRLPQHLPIWTQPPSFRELFPNSVSTPQLIPWIPTLVYLTPVSSERNTTTLLALPKSFFRITRVCKISLLFWEWTNFQKMINCLLSVPVRCRSSFRSLSTA